MASFRLLPHGVYSLIPTVLTSMAWLASIFQDNCGFARLSGDIVADMTSSTEVPWLEVGFTAFREPRHNMQTNQWEVVYTGTCLPYPDVVEIDLIWKTSKAFAFLALVLGGGGTFFLWFSTCCVFSRGTWRWAGYEVLFASFFQALAYIWFRTAMCTSNQCDMSNGSNADIVATLLWFMAAVVIFARYPKPAEPIENDGVMMDPDSVALPSMTVQSSESLAQGTVTTADFQSEASMEEVELESRDVQVSGQDSRQERRSKSMEEAEIV
ncbi:predicted protein [Phaeodactylum tricornutum CCAP 1055/1]|jgi:hypothetical protein|uniref:Uncharacterized protein n=1 Tax=Phaeodactylum tricornutum (strain CCAP 1055/1) TaxID=556484 RepID=B7FZX2_PHATC|nr:predicted protein [Phaeodactylum tricornutum CCAP 1055/1]EEC47786.1 predicted protein [Phaeodactylum tricornutum CCAP 1055/1]|eukprot:XP_002180378.1 predicted protein [Phaeodactylum tricornutum CCAP 1055/1]